MSNWFEVDKAGLAKLMAGRSKAFVLYELLQNAWDQNVTRVDVTVEPAAGTRHAPITVTDDDPDGFADLRDAYTLFAESRKKGNAAQRGRFNLGEKLVLALAKSAWIETTTGAVEFGERGRHARVSGETRFLVSGHDPHDEGRDRGNGPGRHAADSAGDLSRRSTAYTGLASPWPSSRKRCPR